MNVWQALVAVHFRPGPAFAALAVRPRAWIPLLILLASLGALTWVSAPAQVDLANLRAAEMIERVTANLSSEQAEAMRQGAASQMTVQRYLLTALGLGSAGVILGLVLRAGFLHLSGMALGSKLGWQATFGTVAWAAIPMAWRNLLQAALVLAGRGVVAHPGISFLVASGDWLADSRNPVYALLGQVDPFALWNLILLFVGLVAAARLSPRVVAILVVAMWAVFAAFGLVPVLIGTALSSAFIG